MGGAAHREYIASLEAFIETADQLQNEMVKFRALLRQQMGVNNGATEADAIINQLELTADELPDEGMNNAD